MEKLDDLLEQRIRLEERIKRLERDLKSPLSPDEDDDAPDLKNREVLYGLYQVEKQNLERLNNEIQKREHS